MYEHIPFWMQQGVVEWNKGSVELENGSGVVVSSTTVNALRGDSINLIIMDEYAMVRNNIAEEFDASVFPTISSGKTTQLFILSTPKGINHFHRLWVEAEQGKNGFIAKSIRWQDVPGRDAEWEKVQRQKLKHMFAQEHETEFIGSSNTLIASQYLRNITFKEPIIETEEFHIYEKPVRHDKDVPGSVTHTYVLMADTSEGKGLDYHAFSVIDITEYPYKQVATFRSNTMPVTILPQYIYSAAKQYNDAFVLIEVNNLGQQVADILHHELEYENIIRTTTAQRTGQTVSAGYKKNSKMGVKMSVPVKSIGCATLKTMIEDQKLLFWDEDTFSEFTNFVVSGKSYAAEPGTNDDLVMTLVLFGWLSSQQYFKDLTNVSLRKKLVEDNQKWAEEELLPFGYIDDGLNQDGFRDADGNYWAIAEEYRDRNQFFDLTHQDESPEDYMSRLLDLQHSSLSKMPKN